MVSLELSINTLTEEDLLTLLDKFDTDDLDDLLFITIIFSSFHALF